MLLPGADLADLKALARDIYSQLAHLSPRAFKGSRRERELSEKVSAFLRRCSGIAFPRHTILLTRALGLIEGQVGDLVPDRNLLTLAKPRLARLSSWRQQASDILSDLRDRVQRLAGLPERIEKLLAADRPGPDWTPLIAGLVLVAAMQAPEEVRMWAVGAAGLALVFSLLRR